MSSWPFARRTTYVSSSTPSIKADDLNAIQDAIVALYGSAYLFGDGSDGALSASSGTTILSANKMYTTVSLSGTAVLSPASHLVYANQLIQLRDTSKVIADGVAAVDNTAGGAGGLGGGLSSQYLGWGGSGGAGSLVGAGTAGTSRLLYSLGGAGGAGGSGSNGAGGAGGATSRGAQLEYRLLDNLLKGMLSGYDGTNYGSFGIFGGGGGGGGGDDAAGGGYGGGGGGGVIVLCAPVIDLGAGCIITAVGGKGAGHPASPGLGGGSGGGGGGGVVILVCALLIENGTITVAGGLGGTDGGSVGVNGSAGTIIRRVLF